MKHIFLLGLIFYYTNLHAQQELVNPFIGTGGHGHTHPSATAPFGMVQLGPDSRKTGWDGCSGYHFTDSTLHGFSHTHLSGTGVSDYADILFKPITTNGQAHPDSILRFSKSDEKASAGYYSVRLENNILCEFTASQRVGAHRYTFPEGKRAMLFVDLSYRDETLSANLESDGPIMIKGHRNSSTWAQNQKLFYNALFSAPFILVPTAYPYAWILDFGTDNSVIEAYVGLSSTSEDGALKNLKAEMDSFDEMKRKTQMKWNKELGKILVESKDSSSIEIFYTALYHAFSVPNIWNDVDGSYRGMDDDIHPASDRNHYTVFSLWDTYRAAHPLYAIVQPERTSDFIETMLAQFDQYGRLPVWELAANETNCMIGYHSVSVLADAAVKGYEFNKQKALEASVSTASSHIFGLDKYMEYGYLSIQDESESVSKTLEYAYDDGCIAQLAIATGNQDLAKKFRNRASGYRSVTDPNSGLARPRDNGNFQADSDPKEVNSHYTEANAWQYSFSPVHDLNGWLRFIGQGDIEIGRKKLEANLDQLFSESSETTGRNQADITGLIGQYAHGNEPSHHIAYLYNITSKPYKTQEITRKIIKDFYTNQPDGLIGNEDCGQMSAWYVFASLGFYPLAPGWPEYMITSPIWDNAIISLPNNKSLEISKKGSGIYIESLIMNGVETDQAWINHDQLLEGGTWQFKMSDHPTKWGKTNLYSTTMQSDIASAPLIDVKRRFEEKVEAQISFPEGKPFIFDQSGKDLALDGNSLVFKESGELVAWVETGAGKGHVSKSFFTKKPGSWQAEIVEGTPRNEYTAGGPAALVDGIYGDLDWRKGEWVGVQGQDVSIELTSGTPAVCQRIEINLLKDIRAWISLPSVISITGETNGENVDLGVKYLEDVPLRRDESAIYTQEFILDQYPKLDKIVINLTNPGNLPEWHPGAGGETYIFIDEITIR